MGKTLKELKGRLDPPHNYSGVYHTARGKLAAFLDDLDPVFRGLIVGDYTSKDLIDFVEFAPERRQEFDAALAQYHELIGQVAAEWQTHGSQLGRVFRDFADLGWRAGSRLPRRGAPQKALDDRVDVRIAREAATLQMWFEEGFALRLRLKKGKGRASGDSEIVEALMLLRYSRQEADAIVMGRTLRAAAAHFLADRHDKHVAAVQADITRGTKLIRSTARGRE